MFFGILSYVFDMIETFKEEDILTCLIAYYEIASMVWVVEVVQSPDTHSYVQLT